MFALGGQRVRGAHSSCQPLSTEEALCIIAQLLAICLSGRSVFGDSAADRQHALQQVKVEACDTRHSKQPTYCAMLVCSLTLVEGALSRGSASVGPCLCTVIQAATVRLKYLSSAAGPGPSATPCALSCGVQLKLSDASSAPDILPGLSSISDPLGRDLISYCLGAYNSRSLDAEEFLGHAYFRCSEETFGGKVTLALGGVLQDAPILEEHRVAKNRLWSVVRAAGEQLIDTHDRARVRTMPMPYCL